MRKKIILHSSVFLYKITITIQCFNNKLKCDFCIEIMEDKQLELKIYKEEDDIVCEYDEW